MSFYTGLYGSGIYSGMYSSKYGGTTIRQLNSRNPIIGQNNVVADTVIQNGQKRRKINDGKYALATISLMAISLVAGLSMKGGLKGLGTTLAKAGTGIKNLATKATKGIGSAASSAGTAISNTCKSLAGKVGNLFKKT